MKKTLFIIYIFLFISISIMPQDSIKIVILPFQEENISKEYSSYKTLISDTINTYLNKIPKRIAAKTFESAVISKVKNNDDKKLLLASYKPDILSKYYILIEEIDNADEKKIENIFKKISYKKEFININPKELTKEQDITGYEPVYTQALLKGIEIIVYGNYYVIGNRIRIIIKALDVKTERLKAVVTADGETGFNVFDIVIESCIELSEKMSQDLMAYPQDANLYLKDKQSKIIAGYEKERFIFFNIGAEYSGTGLINIEKNVINNLNITDSKNSYMNAINPTFNIEIYGTSMNNYYGFILGFKIPYYFDVPNMQMSSTAALGFSFGYNKEYFFSWTLNLVYNSFQKYGNTISNSYEALKLNVFYMGIGLSFNFRYMPKRYPYYAEFGTLFLPPYIPRESAGSSNNSGGPDIWNISSGINYGDKNYPNWIFPVIFQGAIGYFIKPDFGIYFKFKLMVMGSISYQSYSSYSNAVFYYGKDIGINYSIDFGMVIRNAFK